jgi:uncharacterized protein (DUF697 family)
MKIDANTIGSMLDLAYDKAVKGVPGIPGLEGAPQLAEDYLEDEETLEQKVNKLIRYQVIKASTSGFLSGLGGILTLPVTLPANLVSVAYVQLQMVAAIAHMGGYDVRDDRVRTVCYACLCGSAAADVLKDSVGKVVAGKLAEQAIKNLSYDAILRVNRAIGFRLLTKFGQTGVVNFGKAVPLVGGVIGGTFDGATTYAIGRVAKAAFITGESIEDPEGEEAPVDLSEMLRFDDDEDFGLGEVWSPADGPKGT